MRILDSIISYIYSNVKYVSNKLIKLTPILYLQ